MGFLAGIIMNFIQIHQTMAEKFEEYLKAQGINYTISAVPLVTSTPVMKFEFDALTDTQKQEILEVSQQLQKHYQPSRHRPWDDKMHTPMQEFKGWWSGKNEEEEIDYGRREPV